MSSEAEAPSRLRTCFFCRAVGCGTESCPNRIYADPADGVCLRCGKGAPGNMPPKGTVVDDVVTDAYCELCGNNH